MSSLLFFKTPTNEALTVPWHQDNAYLLPECLGTLQPTAWIPLLDATVRNGCMQVLKGGHRKGVTATHTCCAGGTWYVEVSEKEMEKTLGCDMKKDLVTCEVPYGGVLFLNNCVPHRSLENYSDEIRWSLDLRWQDPNKPSGFWGDKDLVLMRTAKDPGYKPRWEEFLNEEAQVEGGKDNSADLEEDLEPSIQGPWMLLWEIVHHNRHTRALKWKTSTLHVRTASQVVSGDGVPYITAGYRNNLSYQQCIRSIFQIHNETVNIWTHLLPAILFLPLALYDVTVSVPGLHGNWTDYVVIVILHLCYQIVLWGSVYCHTFLAQGCQQKYYQCLAVDLWGIGIVATGGSLEYVVYMFCCSRGWQLFYYGLLGGLMTWYSVIWLRPRMVPGWVSMERRLMALFPVFIIWLAVLILHPLHWPDNLTQVSSSSCVILLYETHSIRIKKTLFTQPRDLFNCYVNQSELP
ncbi:PAQR3 [Branchiostoma lanceolatum]|uniref:PAQR3 protein n=1 Tax=Branchiostoma lanceolatum TaxID=7740 RepID=A0A8J9Z3Q0_BRALA|nr:PAQR3 [Branchiostoma lanceolatum]